MIYTEVETHDANLRERLSVIALLWRCAADGSIGQTRWRLRWMAVRGYVFSRRPQVSYYLVNRNG